MQDGEIVRTVVVSLPRGEAFESSQEGAIFAQVVGFLASDDNRRARTHRSTSESHGGGGYGRPSGRGGVRGTPRRTGTQVRLSYGSRVSRSPTLSIPPILPRSVCASSPSSSRRNRSSIIRSATRISARLRSGTRTSGLRRPLLRRKRLSDRLAPNIVGVSPRPAMTIC